MWGLGCSGPEPQWIEPDPWEPGEPLVKIAGLPPRNVFMLSIDTLRRDHIDRYGGSSMPFLSSLLEQSVTLDNHQQCSNWTYASTVCTLLGRYNEETDFFPKIFKDTREPMPHSQPTLARILGDHGYESFLVSGNGWLSEEWNTDQGYTHGGPAVGGSARYLTTLGMDTVSDALGDRDPPSRWFLHVHVMEPHVPYAPPAEYLTGLAPLDPIDWDLAQQATHYEATGQWPTLPPEEQELLEAHLRVRYAAELRYLDDQLALWWADMEADGFLDDTLVVIWNDHGEQFWEHGNQSHAWSLAAEENDGLLAFYARGLQPASYEGPTHSVDMLPTLLHALALPPSEGSGFVVGTESATRARFSAVAGRAGPIQTLTQEDWKLQFTWNTGELRLWNRAVDPEEAIDLYTPSNARAVDMWPLLQQQVRLMEPLAPEYTPMWPSFP